MLAGRAQTTAKTTKVVRIGAWQRPSAAFVAVARNGEASRHEEKRLLLLRPIRLGNCFFIL